MFGEDDPDYLRAPSPWDDFISTPPSEPGSLDSNKALRHGIPKLAPEIEEGNVEYKLKLTDISPARFARLVTQLKWRLLEGSGQAFYELGVADSGALIGLSRSDLEQSLETLEMMAGEIGASVIVVKEIEVPPAMVAFADKVSAYIDPETGKWTEKMSNKRFRNGVRSDATAAGTETEADVTDTDDDPSTVATPNFLPSHPREAILVPYSHRLTSANPNRPSSQSSPSIVPLDDDLALFSMEPEPEFADESVDVADHKNDALDLTLPVDDDIPAFSLDIEISSVFKPRPFRRRGDQPGAGVFNGKQARKIPKPQKQRPWVAHSPGSIDPLSSPDVPLPSKQDAKALLRRQARDRRREEKRKLLLASAAPAGVVEGKAVVENNAALPIKEPEPDGEKLQDDAVNLTSDLRSLHVSVSPAKVVVDEAPTPAPPSPTPEVSAVAEPRLIVEALVVRKMSLEEGFLDIAGFGLS